MDLLLMFILTLSDTCDRAYILGWADVS